MEKMIGDKYQIIREAGAGGGGRVFQVRDLKLGRIWAAKQLDRKRAMFEEQLLGALDSLMFVRIVDSVDQGDSRFLIMDWIEGESLQQRIDQGGTLSPAEAVKLGIELCRALEYLHGMEPPVLYLDCKPSNIMLGKDGRIVLIDFGSAVLCERKMAVPITGSIGYTAPEQRRTDPGLRSVDVRSDIFGLGKTLYAALSGQCPDRPPYGVLPLRRANGAVPAGLCRIVEKCTAEEPEKRYQTAAALRLALERYTKNRHNRIWIWRGMTGSILVLLLLSAWRFSEWICGNAEIWDSNRQRGERIRLLAESDRSLLCGGVLFLFAAWLVQRIRQFCFSARSAKWEMRQSVLRTLKKQGGLLLLLFLLLQEEATGRNVKNEVYAAGDDTKMEWFALRDSRFHKLLVKEGTVLDTDDRVYIELDPERFEEDKVYRISVAGTDGNGQQDELLLHFRVCRGK